MQCLQMTFLGVLTYLNATIWPTPPCAHNTVQTPTDLEARCLA